MDNETITLIKKLAKLLNFKLDDENLGNSIKELFISNDMSYHIHRFNKEILQDLNLENFMGDIAYVQSTQLANKRDTIKDLIPYDYYRNVIVAIPNELILKIVDNNNTIKTIDDVVDNLPTLNDLLNEYNKDKDVDEKLYLEDLDPYQTTIKFNYSYTNETFRDQINDFIDNYTSNEALIITKFKNYNIWIYPILLPK